MKKLGIFLLSSMLLLMNSCSETSSPGLEWLGDEVAVRFTTTMQPSVEILPLTRAEDMIKGEVLPAGEKVGIYGIRTKTGAEVLAWEDATFHRQMKNKQYLVEENHTLSPANGEVDYYPFMDSVLTVYAYAPYAATQKVDADGYLSVNLSDQIDYLVTGEQLIPKDREADEVVKQLSFRHAMGAVAFRFYTDDWELHGTDIEIESIILTLNYDHTNLKLSLANGTFQGDFSKEEGNAYWISFEEGTKAKYSSDPTTTISPIAHTMLVPGDDFQITQLILYYQDGRESEKTLDTPITVEAGKTTVLNINCQKKAGTTPQLIVDKTGNASSELPPL